MKISLSEDEYPKDHLYLELISLCEEIKLVLGPEGLSSTLRRHKSIYNFLLNAQKDSLSFYEKKIDKYFS